MNDTPDKQAKLSPALEDYLETLWNILQDHKVARVKEIAIQQGVNMASVTPALKRLHKMGLVEYAAREYVDLTPEGERLARRIRSRHDLITRFLHEVLGVSMENARKDACSAEHVFSDETIDRLVRLFEYLQRCGNGHGNFVNDFLSCSVVHPENVAEGCHCNHTRQVEVKKRFQRTRYLSNLEPGVEAHLVQVNAEPDMRQQLIDAGLLPGCTVRFLHMDPDGESVWISLDGNDIPLSIDAASSVIVSMIETAAEPQ